MRASSCVESLGELRKPGDNEVSSRVWHRVGRTAWSPFVGTAHERGPVTLPARRIEVEIVAGHHQDFAGRYAEELCGKLVRLRPGLVDAQHLARITASQVIPLRRETSMTRDRLRIVKETQT